MERIVIPKIVYEEIKSKDSFEVMLIKKEIEQKTGKKIITKNLEFRDKNELLK